MFVFKAIKPPKNKSGESVLKDLNRFLNAASPELVYWLCNNWNNQRQAITYNELRAACLQGFEPQIRQWQEDYAKFVNEKLTPLWLNAMHAGAAQTSAKHDTFVFDDTAQEVRKFLQDHGAEFVTAVSQEARAAIRAIIMRGQAERWSVDQISRAIRPTIGLNAPQAVANANYRQHVLQETLKQHPNYTFAQAEAKAQEAALKYAAKQQRYRASTIAETELAYAYNVGQHESVRQAIKQGLMGQCQKIWSTSGDARVCARCRTLSGTTIGFDEPFGNTGAKLSALSPDIVPPAHPRCRCTVEYEEISPPVFAPPPKIEPQRTWNGRKIADIPDPPDAVIPPTIKMPSGMKDMGHIHLGGTGEMHKCVDTTGKEWLFKPAADKGGATEVAFRAYIQEAAYKLQSIIDPDTAVKVGTGRINGTFGAFQEMLDVAPTNPMAMWQRNMLAGKMPTPSDMNALAETLHREHVTDWLLGNFDSHGKNFIQTKAGKIIGIDKEQSLKYIGDVNSHKMSVSYHPNKAFGETEPIYNTFFRAFADRKINLNPQDSLPFIKRVEAISDVKYREMFRGYAEALKGKGGEAEKLLDLIVERKQNLRETYREFYSDLLTVRTGKKQAFVFADETSGVLKQPLTAQMHDPAVLQKLNKHDLLQIAKTKKIAYYGSMNKAQLIKAIADPVEAKRISKQVKEQIDNAKAAKLTAQQTAAKTPPKKLSGSIDAADFFKDPSVAPVDRQGIAIRSDADKIEGMNLTARKETIGGKDYYCIYGKLGEGQYISLSGGMKRLGDKSAILKFHEADDVSAIFYKNSTVGIIDSMKVPVRKLSTAQGEVILVDLKKNDYYALNNFFTVRVPAGANAANDLQTLLDNIGAKWMTETPKIADELTLKKRRALWVRHPEYSGQEIAFMSESEIDALLAKDKITAKELQNMRLENVWKGYNTYIDDTLIKEAKDAGALYVWSGVTSADAVVAVVQSGGLACTKNRCIMGNAGNGKSMESDFRSGGADSVFTRLGVKTKNSRFEQCFAGEVYRIKIDVSVLGRTDWYAYEADMYGEVKDIGEMKAKRKRLSQLIGDMKKHYLNGNEIMFRNGIRREKFIGINCDTEHRRQILIDKFHAAGVTEINGTPVEKFITVESVIGK